MLVMVVMIMVVLAHRLVHHPQHREAAAAAEVSPDE
jgi:hypothetical protein